MRRSSFAFVAPAGLAALTLLAVFSVACDLGLPAGRTPHREGNFLDMNNQPKLKPQRKDIFGARPTGMMEPQAGTVARGATPYPYAQNEAERAGLELKNPLPATPGVIAHGKFVYERVCITCHGPGGAGDGMITSASMVGDGAEAKARVLRAAGDGQVAALFPRPPSLMTQKVRDWPDGQIFHRPMRGQNSMPSHARQVDQDDAWSVVHYIRRMQSEQPVAPAPASPSPLPAAAPAPAASVAQGGK
jgi:mono/diheme cytochrome c family protein